MTAAEDPTPPFETLLGFVSKNEQERQELRLRLSVQQLKQLLLAAYHDPLTGLPNRLLLDDRLSQAFSAAHRHYDKLAVLFADLDNFKSVNDRFGHAVGDALLKAVANSLVACLRSNDTVSRYGGDEFVMLLTDIQDVHDVATAVQKIAASLETVHRIGPHELQITASIGISIYPDHGEAAEALLNKADAAMYRAKTDGGTKYRFAA